MNLMGIKQLIFLQKETKLFYNESIPKFIKNREIIILQSLKLEKANMHGFQNINNFKSKLNFQNST